MAERIHPLQPPEITSVGMEGRVWWSWGIGDEGVSFGMPLVAE
jgi:hypothetical protein